MIDVGNRNALIKKRTAIIYFKLLMNDLIYEEYLNKGVCSIYIYFHFPPMTKHIYSLYVY